MTESEACAAVEPTIRNVVRAFCRRNTTLDCDEVMGEAWVIALDAIRRFNGQGELGPWVGWVLTRRLSKLYLTNGEWRRRVERQEHKTLISEAAVPDRPAGFSLYSLLDAVSLDARVVLKHCLRANARSAASIFHALRVLGWSIDRISRAFREIRENL